MIGLACGLLLLACAVIWYSSTSSKDLLAQSRMFLDPGPLSQRGPVLVHGWTSDHEVLLSNMLSYFAYDFYALDTRTGRRRYLPVLTSAHHKRILEGIGIPESVSPDGKWLLSESTSRGDPDPHDPDHSDAWQLEIGGNRIYHVSTGPDASFKWSSDGNSCIAWDPEKGSILKWQRGATSPMEMRRWVKGDVQSWPLGTVGNNLVVRSLKDGEQTVPIDELVWTNPAYARRLCAVKCSGDLGLDDIQISPDGKRIAWADHYTVKRPGPPWMQWVFRRLGAGGGDYKALWTSRTDGSDRREIGHIVQDSNNLQARRFIYNWGWTFGSKGLWYEYGDKFFCVPIR